MRLIDFMVENHLDNEDMAQLLDICKVYVGNIKNLTCVPSYKLAKKIELVTGGLVTREEAMGEK